MNTNETSGTHDEYRRMLPDIPGGENFIETAARTARAQLTGDGTPNDSWTVAEIKAKRLAGGSGRASATLGVWAVEARVGGDEVVTFVAKVIQGDVQGLDGRWQTDSSSLHPFYWAKETDYYQEPLLQEPVGGLRTPRSYGTAIDGKKAVAAIEFVTGHSGEKWELPEYAEAMQRLGHMQGTFFLRMLAGERMPSWLQTGFTREHIRRAEVFDFPAFTDERAWQNPWMNPFKKEVSVNNETHTIRELVEKSWSQRTNLVSIIDRLPTVTLCHNDLWPAQLIRKDGVIMVDPAQIGKGPLGLDAGNLAMEAAVRLSAPRSARMLQEVNDFLFSHYQHGLRFAGVNMGNEHMKDLVQLGYDAGIVRWTDRVGYWTRLATADVRDDVGAIDEAWLEGTPQEVNTRMTKMFEDWAEQSLYVANRADRALELAPLLDLRSLDLHTAAVPDARALYEQGSQGLEQTG